MAAKKKTTKNKPYYGLSVYIPRKFYEERMKPLSTKVKSWSSIAKEHLVRVVERLEAGLPMEEDNTLVERLTKVEEKVDLILDLLQKGKPEKKEEVICESPHVPQSNVISIHKGMVVLQPATPGTVLDVERMALKTKHNLYLLRTRSGTPFSTDMLNQYKGQHVRISGYVLDGAIHVAHLQQAEEDTPAQKESPPKVLPPPPKRA